MKKRTVAFKGALFTAIILCLCTVLAPVFRETRLAVHYGALLETLDGLPRDSVDVVFIGGSTYQNGISPLVMWEEKGITSFNYSVVNQPSWIGYLEALETLKRQQPKLVVLQVKLPENNYLGPEPEDTFQSRINRAQRHMAYIPMSTEKLRVMADCAFRFNKDLPGLQTFAGYLFPILVDKAAWSEVTAETYREIPYSETFGQMYNNITITNMPDLSLKLEGPKQIEPIHCDEATLEYSQKTIQLLLDSGVQVCIMSLPANNWSWSVNSALNDLAAQYGIQHVDLNLAESLDAMGLDYGEDFCNRTHLNVWGSMKVSKYLAERLDSLYDLPDGRGTSPLAAELDENLAAFKDKVEELEPVYEEMD